MSKTKEFLENLCKLVGHDPNYVWTSGVNCFIIKCPRCETVIYKYEYSIPNYVGPIPPRTDIEVHTSDGTSHWNSYSSSSIHNNYYSS